MKVGDKVSVLDDDLRGKIIKIEHQKIKIEDEYGFTHWFSCGELVIKDKDFYEDIAVIKKNEEGKNNSKKHQKSELKLDLHFDQLVDFPEQYEAWERSFIQKEKLVQMLDFCKANKIKKLEIIHGLGDGILQEIVYDVLRGYAGIEFEENEFFKHSSASVEILFK